MVGIDNHRSEQLSIMHSIRQECLLSSFVYVLTLETLLWKLETLRDISRKVESERSVSREAINNAVRKYEVDAEVEVKQWVCSSVPGEAGLCRLTVLWVNGRTEKLGGGSECLHWVCHLLPSDHRALLIFKFE